MELIRRVVAKIQQLLVCGEEKRSRKAELCTPGAVLRFARRKTEERGGGEVEDS